MKKIEWATPNKMLIDTGHKTFDRQTNVIMTGNVIANTQHSGFIRAWQQTEVNGLTRDPGHLQNWNLGGFQNIPAHVKKYIREQAHARSVILYRFFYHNGRRAITHGWVVTTDNHTLLRSFITGPTDKSRYVIQEVTQYIADCPHRPERVCTWYAADGTLCAACYDCGQVLAGAAPALEEQ